VEPVDLPVEQFEHPAQRDHPPAIHLVEASACLLDQPDAANAEQVAPRHGDAGTGEMPWTLALEVGADADELGRVADQAAQLADLRRGDPRLRQPIHPRQVGEVGGVAHGVLHPRVLERLDPERAAARLEPTGSARTAALSGGRLI